jgi:hypothetical protein
MVDSIGLREMAEYASSLRHAHGDKAYFVISADPHHPGNYIIKHLDAPPEPPEPDQVVVPADTANVGSHRPKVKRVTIRYEDPSGGPDREMVLPGGGFDALFWSEASVEKFLFPYYASKYQWAAADWLTVMSQAWYGFVPDLRGPGSAPAAEDGLTPLAMVHYPRSEYGSVGENGVAGPGNVVGPGNDVHVLTVKPTGEAALRRLSEYRRP